MPMDIRSFFTKKPASAGGNKAADAATAAVGTVPKETGTAPPAQPSLPLSSRSKKGKVANVAKVGNNTTTTNTSGSANNSPSQVSGGKPHASRKEDRRHHKDTKTMKGFTSSEEEEDDDNDFEEYRKQSPKKKLKPSSFVMKDTAAQAAKTAAVEDTTAVAKNDQRGRTSPSKTKVATPGGSGRKRIRDDEPKEEDDNYVPPDSDSGKEDRVTPPTPKRSSPAATKKAPNIVHTPSPLATSSPRSSPSKRSKTPDIKKPTPILQPTLERDSFDIDKDAVVPECLAGLTFVFTGILENLQRDNATDLIKSLGGRVTTAVSGKTSYLVVGQVLEDGRDVQDGKKYQTAVERNIPMVVGESKLYGLCYLYQNLKKKEAGITETPKLGPAATTKVTSTQPTPTAKASTVPSAKVPSKVNPYAKAPAANPYTKSTVASGVAAVSANNPYAKKNPYGKVGAAAPAPAPDTSTTKSNNSTLNQLWVDRHAPKSTRDILGNKDNIQKLAMWLNTWERTFNNPKSYDKTFSNPKGPWKAALLSGPPGIGKTTTATLVAKEAGRDLREFNASDARSKKALQEQLGDLTGSQALGFQVAGAKPRPASAEKTLRCVIMDEVDGMGAGDRSGMAELIQMIKKSKVPIICICNDRQSQKMKSLLPYCMDLRFKRPTKSIMANRAVRIAEMEGLSVERNAAEAIAESCGNDVRQVLNVLQMWAQKKGSEDNSLTYKNLKERESSINKDEILRVSLFDAAKTIMEGRKGLTGANAKTQVDSLFRRSDAFFVDYSFTGLLVQQNYLRVMQSQYGLVKKADNGPAELKFLNRMHDAAASMSDYALFEHEIRSGDQNWSLLPASSMMTVKTGFHAGGKTGGSLPGYPEFTAWMGKNSSKNKKQRILNELHHHMNFRISADSQQLRESYLPVLRERFLTYFQSSDRSEEANDAVIELMDDYGLNREDVMEKLDEFTLTKKGEGGSFADLDSKQKAAFTRRYNQGSHKSQALVQEEFGSTKPKRSGGKRERDPHDLDAIDDDGDLEEESEGEDEEAELRKLQAKQKKKPNVAPKAGAKGKKTK